jgi:hypothetical protein
MAEIVQSLFGITPESYRATQQERADAQALQYAKLDPFQQANFAIGRGASMLGGAIGGALGGQDPELQRITMRQQIARQLNPNDPASIQQGIAALSEAGDSQGAMMLQAEYRKLVESKALVGQREASALASSAQATRERTQAVPNDIQIARELANLEETLTTLTAMPESPERDIALRRVSTQLANLRNVTAKADKNVAFGTDREAVSAEVYNKPFAQLTPTERAVINKRVDEENNRRAKSSAASFNMPGQKDFVDIPAFRAKVQSTIEPQSKAVFAADNALTAIEDSIKTNNFVSFNAARVQLAKALGDSQLSRRDVEQAGGDPSLLGGLADTASKLFSGTPTLDTQNKIKKTLQAIKTVATSKANDEINRQRNIALRSPQYNPEAVNAALDFPEFKVAPVAPQYATNPQTKERIMSTDGGKTWTPVR